MRQKRWVWQEWKNMNNLNTNHQKPAQLAEECFRSSLVSARHTSRSSTRESLRISSQMLGSTEEREGPVDQRLVPCSQDPWTNASICFFPGHWHSFTSTLPVGPGWASAEMTPDQPVAGTALLCQGPWGILCLSFFSCEEREDADPCYYTENC